SAPRNSSGASRSGGTGARSESAGCHTCAVGSNGGAAGGRRGRDEESGIPAADMKKGTFTGAFLTRNAGKRGNVQPWPVPRPEDQADLACLVTSFSLMRADLPERLRR